MNSITIKENVNLTPYNTFGISVLSRYFSTVKNAAEIKALMQDPRWQLNEKFVLGGGSNILFTQHFPGLVIKNEIRGIEKSFEDEDFVWLKVGAGEEWHSFVIHCISQGFGGIENLSLIPGTVGAAPMQNIGAYGVEVKDVFVSLEAIHLETGDCIQFDNEACQFGYRHSIFKQGAKNQYCITNVTLALRKKPIFKTDYAALNDYLQTKNLTLKTISDAVIDIRQSKLPDPRVIGNAGSFFKNPIIPSHQFVSLQKKYPAIPHFLEDFELIKIPAGWLIEQCGWKGKRMGEVGVHDKQALVLVNYGKATGSEIKFLSEQIQQSVLREFGINLIPEVNIL